MSNYKTVNYFEVEQKIPNRSQIYSKSGLFDGNAMGLPADL